MGQAMSLMLCDRMKKKMLFTGGQSLGTIDPLVSNTSETSGNSSHSNVFSGHVGSYVGSTVISVGQAGKETETIFMGVLSTNSATKEIFIIFLRLLCLLIYRL